MNVIWRRQQVSLRVHDTVRGSGAHCNYGRCGAPGGAQKRRRSSCANAVGSKALLLLFCGFFAAISSRSDAQQKGWPRAGNFAGSSIQASPLIVNLDLDNAGRNEILVPSQDDRLYIYNHDGTTFTLGNAWPKTLGYGDGTMASVAVGNVDAVSGLEIILLGDDTSAANCKIKALKPNGDGLVNSQMTEVTLSATASGKATPCLLDVFRYSGTTRHSASEIVVRDGDGRIHILSWNSSTNVFDNKAGTGSWDTCTSESQKDRFGSLAITPSVSAAYDSATDQTYIVAGSTDGRVYRWKIKSVSGSSSDNWQVTSLSTIATDSLPGTRILSSPVIMDIDGVSGFEIIAATTSQKVYLWHNDSAGTLLANWPQTVEQTIYSSPAVADIDLDGSNEIILGGSDSKVHVWETSGTIKAGWPRATRGDVFASPIVAEIDGNVGLEIIVPSMGERLYAWTHTGEPLPGWPKRLRTLMFGAAAVGDLHNSDRIAIVVGTYTGRVYCFDLAPKSLDVNLGWPQFRGGPARTGNVGSNP